MKVTKQITVMLLSALLLITTGCSQRTGSQTQAEKVTVVLDWTPNTNHTGLYAALANGYFAQAGLDVDIVQPPEGGAEMLVASGKAQFCVTFQDSLAPAFAGDDPLPITAVAAVIQHNTSGILSRKGEGMERPAGLEGRKYATWDMEVEKATLRQVMQADGGDFDRVELIPSTVTDEVSALRSGSVDAIWVFYAWAGKACEVAGLDTDYFAFADIDPVFDFYTPVLAANNEFLAQKPEVAEAFLAAVSKGYEFAVSDPRAAADILMAAAPELEANKELVYASQEYLAGEYVADAPRWGEIDPARWAAYFDWMNDHKLLSASIDSSAGFTNEFLPEA